MSLAAQEKLEFQRAAIELGTESSVSTIQDRDGFLWFSTTNSGLVRYDGYSVTKFRPGPNSVNNGWTNAIFEDSKGVIWIGTNGGGLNRYDKETNRFSYYTHDPKNKNSISSNVFMMFGPLIVEDVNEAGVLWLGTQGGLNRFDTKTETFVHFTHDSTKANTISHNEVYSIQQDAEGVLWIGTKNGLNRFDPGKLQFTRYTHDANNPNSLPDPEVWSVLDDDSLLWVGTGKGELLAFNKKNRTFKKKHTYGATVLGLEKLSGNRLALTGGAALNGLTVYDITTGEGLNYQPEEGNSKSLSNNGIKSLFQDRHDIIWIVHHSGTVDKFDKKAQKFTPYKPDPTNTKTIPNEIAFPRQVDAEGNVWIGFPGGLVKFDPRTERFATYGHDPKNPKSLPQNYASSIYQDSEGTLWVGTFTGGMVSWDTKKNEVIKKVDISAVYKMIEDPHNTDILWCGTYLNGFVKYNKKTDEITQYKNDPENPKSLAANISVTMLQDKDDPNILWVGMLGTGLDKFDKKAGTFTHIMHNAQDSTSIPGNMTWNLTYDSEGSMWIGTDKGLGKFDPKTGTSKNFTEAKGFPTNNCHFILEDDHKNLWIGTDKGLLQFDIATETVEKIYTKADGIQGMPFFCTGYTKAPDGTFWIGGFKGLNQFHPDSLKDNSYQPPVYLTSLTQGGEPIELTSALEHTKEIILDWKHNYFEFEYAALNYTLPEKNQYQYMLQGWEEKWYDAGTLRKGRYSVLDPGTYTLRVRGSNNDGVWSDKEVALKITVLTPPWRTPAAYALYSILILVVIAAYLYSQERKRRELEKLVDRRTAQLKNAKEEAEEANNAKSDFIANMSHEIRTPMNAVLGFTEILREEVTEPYQRKYLDTIYTSGTALLHLINDILDLSKVESGKMELNPVPMSVRVLASEMHTIFYQKIDNKGLDFKVDVDTAVPSALFIDEIRLRQVLINLIGNAVKFTDQGYISLSVKAEEEQESGSHVKLELIVEDTGIGVPEDQQEKIFGAFEQVKGQNLKLYGGTGLGLAISSRLIALMGGRIDLVSQPGKGATFTITLPEMEVTSEEALSKKQEVFSAASIDFKPSTILVVDDVDYNREIIATFLKGWDFSIIQATNGKDAVDLAVEHTPDLILMDMKMPIMNGYDAAQKIHENPTTKDIPIIAVTASTLKRDEVVLSNISDSFIRKPVSKADLVKEIMPFLEHTVSESVQESVEKELPVIYPDTALLEELMEMVEAGYLDQVKERVASLVEADKQYEGFFNEVRNYCSLFDDDGLLEFLKEG